MPTISNWQTLRLDVDSVSGGGAGNIEFQTQALTLSDTRVQRRHSGDRARGIHCGAWSANCHSVQSNSVIAASAINTGEGIPGPFGPAGTIVLETQQLTMQGGSALKAADLPLSQGNAGNITVRETDGPAQSILIDGAGTGIFTDAEGNGAGGGYQYPDSISSMSRTAGTLGLRPPGRHHRPQAETITVNATDTVTMNSASIKARAPGSRCRQHQ